MRFRWRKSLIFGLLLLAGGAFFTGINWGLPSRDSDRCLFGERTPWSGAEIMRLAGAWDDGANRGADIAMHPLDGRDRPIVLNDTDAKRAEIVRRYRLYSNQPDEMITFRSLARMKPGKLDLDPRLYQYGGLWIYPIGGVLKLASLAGVITLRTDLAFYLDHPEAFGRFYLVARYYSAMWGMIGVLVVYAIGREWTGRSFVGATAAAVYASMPVVINAAHEAKPHLPGTVLTLLTVWAGLRFVRSGQRRWWLIAAGSAGAAMGMVLTGYAAFAVLPVMMLLRPMTWQRRIALTAAAGAIGVGVFVLTNPYLPYNYLFNRAALKSNVGNYGTFYRPGISIEALATAGRLLIEGTSLAPVLVAATGVVLMGKRSTGVSPVPSLDVPHVARPSNEISRKDAEKDENRRREDRAFTAFSSLRLIFSRRLRAKFRAEERTSESATELSARKGETPVPPTHDVPDVARPSNEISRKNAEKDENRRREDRAFTVFSSLRLIFSRRLRAKFRAGERTSGSATELSARKGETPVPPTHDVPYVARPSNEISRKDAKADENWRREDRAFTAFSSLRLILSRRLCAKFRVEEKRREMAKLLPSGTGETPVPPTHDVPDVARPSNEISRKDAETDENRRREDRAFTAFSSLRLILSRRLCAKFRVEEKRREMAKLLPSGTGETPVPPTHDVPDVARPSNEISRKDAKADENWRREDRAFTAFSSLRLIFSRRLRAKFRVEEKRREMAKLLPSGTGETPVPPTHDVPYVARPSNEISRKDAKADENWRREDRAFTAFSSLRLILSRRLCAKFRVEEKRREMAKLLPSGTGETPVPPTHDVPDVARPSNEISRKDAKADENWRREDRAFTAFSSLRLIFSRRLCAKIRVEEKRREMAKLLPSGTGETPVLRRGLLLAAPAVLVLIQFVLLAAGKAAEYARFAITLDVLIAITAAAVIDGLRLKPREKTMLASLLVAATLFYGCRYDINCLIDNRPNSSRRLAAAKIEHLIGRADVLAVWAEPAPYCMPPVDLFAWKIVLLPRGAPASTAGAMVGAVAVRPVDDGVIAGDPPSRPVSPIGWANKPFQITRVNGP